MALLYYRAGVLEKGAGFYPSFGKHSGKHNKNGLQPKL